MTHEENERQRAVIFNKHLNEHRRSKDSYCVADSVHRQECDDGEMCWCDMSAMGISPHHIEPEHECPKPKCNHKWAKWAAIIFVAHFAVDVALIAVAAMIGVRLW